MTNTRIATAILINLLITVVEVVAGVLAGSLALLSDALHNFTDVGTLVLSWWGERLRQKPPTPEKTYGYKRAEILIALANASVLAVVVGVVAIAAMQRLIRPTEVSAGLMGVTAAVALVGNGIAAALLKKDSHRNLNIRSAWLHTFQDAVLSLGVLAAAVVVSVFDWPRADPVIALVLSAFVLRETWGLLSETVSILMESVPAGLSVDDVRTALRQIPMVHQIDDLHVWQTGSDNRFLSAHIVTGASDNADRNQLLGSIQRVLVEQFGISHTTVQLVGPEAAADPALSRDHCN